MKYLKLKLIALFVTVAAISACSNDNECSAEGNVPVVAVTGPETALVGQEITFVVSHKLLNDCSSFKEFKQNSVFPRDIYVSALYEGCSGCNPINIIETAEYKFSAAQPGKYELVFHGDPGNVVKTVTVTAPE